MTVHACTIIARNYLPAARVLATSFAKHHPGGHFSALVIDDAAAPIDVAAEPFTVLGLHDIGLEPGEAEKMAAIYDVMELSTAVKPWLLATLLARGAPSVCYLDPDIELFAPLEDVARLAADEAIVVTPHVTRPLPRDGKSASESELLASGMYNLGFIALSTGAGAFLEFWKERLARECVTDPARMRFVDQRWVDFVPGVFGAAILRDPTYNVAYWNLDHRALTFDGERYLVDGAPLHFFHFSGYRPDAPWLLSRHQGERPRILLSEHPDLARLCDEYGRELLVAGYREENATAYGYGRLANGLVYDPVMRALYRAALLEAEASRLRAAAGAAAIAEEPPNPFVEDGGEAFLAWLNAVPPERPGGRVTRYLMALHASRVDLQGAFSDIDGDGFALFAEWSLHEVGQGRLDARLAIHAGVAAEAKRFAAAPGLRPPVVLPPGIRVAGYFRTETGVGEHARLVARCVERAGIRHSTFVDIHSVGRQAHPYVEAGSEDLDVNLICVNADELPHFARRVGPAFFEGHYTIGLWAWELEELPARFAPSFSYLDEVWGNSDFTRDAIARISPIPVHAFPLPILDAEAVPEIGRPELGLGDAFTFLFCFDLMSIVERKNPLGLIEAFTRAFAPGEGPVLVVKAVNATRRQPELERLKWAAAQRPDIVVLDAYLSTEQQRALMASCDCYVSLHRSEGFGLTMAEAMALGKPVIATAYSGNMGFMSEDTAYLVPWSPGAVPVANDPYPHGARWADPDLDAAAHLMRHVVAHPDEASAKGARARADVLANHGVDARAHFVAERFAHAEQVLAARRRQGGGQLRGRVRRSLGRATS